MAYIRKVGDKWKAEVERLGKRASRRFPTKREAQLWAAATEADIVRGSDKTVYTKTVRDGVDRYVKEVTAKKATAKQERLRLYALVRDYGWLADKVMAEVTTADLARWRDARLAQVSPSSVLREMTAFKHMFKLALREWCWMQKDSPWDGLTLPQAGLPRKRRIAPSEVRRIARALGFVSGQAPTSKMAEIGLAFLLSLRTAMRSGEVLGLCRSTVDLRARVAVLHQHKTAHDVGAREVPLTRHAVRLLHVLDAAARDAGRDALFTVDVASKDALFRRVVTGLGIVNLRFHDARAEALTRLSRRVDVMTLARISGHKDINILLNTYYRESARDIAARL